MILILELRLGTFRARADSFGIIPVESPTGLRVKQLRPVLIMPGNQQRHTKWPTHDSLLAICALAESQRQITDRLRCALHAQRLVVVEGVALALNTGVLNHRSGIGLETGHGAADVAVDLDDFLDRGGLKEGGRHALLDAEDDAFGGCDADSC